MQKINKSGFCKDETLKQVCCACSTFGCVFLMKKNDLCLVQPPPPVVLFSKQHHSIEKRARVVTSYIHYPDLHPEAISKFKYIISRLQAQKK